MQGLLLRCNVTILQPQREIPHGRANRAFGGRLLLVDRGGVRRYCRCEHPGQGAYPRPCTNRFVARPTATTIGADALGIRLRIYQDHSARDGDSNLSCRAAVASKLARFRKSYAARLKAGASACSIGANKDCYASNPVSPRLRGRAEQAWPLTLGSRRHH